MAIRRMRESDLEQINEMKKKQRERVEKLRPGEKNSEGFKTKSGRVILFSHVVGPDD